MTRRTITRARRRTAGVLVVLSILVALIIVIGWMPGVPGTAVSVVLPALAALAALLAVVTLLVLPRAAIAASLVVLVALVAMWPALPGPAAAPGDEALTIVSQNVRAQSGGGEASADALMADSPDVITLTELDTASRDAAGRTLDAAYPHAYAVGTVGVWSKYPLTSGEPLDLGLGWNRALRVTVQAPAGDVRLYLVHAASVRPGAQTMRDDMLAELADTIRADDSAQIIALGDFNSATTDPALRALGAELDLVRPTDGTLGLSWPAPFPVVKIDHVFQRGFAVNSATTQRAGASDHLATVTVLSPQ